MRRREIIAGLGSAGAFALAAPLASRPAHAATRPVRIGVLTDMSGPARCGGRGHTRRRPLGIL